MVVKFKKAFKFNLDTYMPIAVVIDQPTEEDIANNEYTFYQYLDELILDVIADDRGKKFLFPEEGSALITIIEKVIEGDTDRPITDAAKRLLRSEQTIQERMDRLSIEVQKGLMIQALVEYNGKNIFLIIKAEHIDFINERDNKRATGLPIKKKIFKSFCGYLNEEDKPDYAIVSDNSKKISTYWWQGFLELVKERNEEYNTETAYEAIEKKVLGRMKDKHPEDYWNLRNTTISYFRSNDEFILADYIDTVITSYPPQDPELNIEALATRIRELPEREKFDERFELVREMITNRIVKKVFLNPQLDLVIKEAYDKNMVKACLDNEGVKCIRIRTDKGYEQFPKEDEES